MRVRRSMALVFALSVTTLGCRDKTPVPAAPPTVSAAPARADNDGCGFVPATGHTNPARLLADYLQHDGAGEFTRSDGWRDSAMACPAHAPGWDGFTLIASYKSDSLGTTADSARYLVTYQRLGLLEQDTAGFYIKDDVGEEKDTIVLARTSYGWRVADLDQEPHLLPAGALLISTLRPSDAERLRNMARP